MKGRKNYEPHHLFCSNPECLKLYSAEAHKEGTAVKVGKAHYCCRTCADTAKERLKRGERK